MESSTSCNAIKCSFSCDVVERTSIRSVTTQYVKIFISRRGLTVLLVVCHTCRFPMPPMMHVGQWQVESRRDGMKTNKLCCSVEEKAFRVKVRGLSEHMQGVLQFRIEISKLGHEDNWSSWPRLYCTLCT